jgi:signal transduction histidine kinase
VTIQIYDLAAANSEVRFSPFCWRVKLALAFKGLKFESIPIRFVEKNRIAFSGQKLLPVLVDNEKVIVDSWDIACYLDKFYPTDLFSVDNYGKWRQYRVLKFWNFLSKSPTVKTPVTPASASTTSELGTNDGLSPQEKYDYLSEYGAHILCLLSTEKGCTYLSKNFESITGHPCAERLGDNLYDIIHRDYHGRIHELLQVPVTDTQPKQLRCKLQHADKKWYWYLFLIQPKRGGAEGEYVCVVENINDNMVTQNTLQKARLEAELALRSRSEFLANMSHELRTPLNAVIGFSQIIESGIFGKIDNPQYMEYIKHIQESGFDLLAKIEDLLEIANIDAGRVTLDKEEVYVSEILRLVLEAQTHHALAAKVILNFDASQKDVLLYVDRLKLQHILGHLVANAIKFSKAGSTITLRATPSQHGLEIGVHDTGAGIAEDKLDAIITALQEDNCWTTVNDNHSIGLGLALTREFVALHGGQVNVTSKPTEGTSITIALPMECVRTTPAKSAPQYIRQAVS